MKSINSFLTLLAFVLISNMSFAQVLVVDWDFGSSKVIEEEREDIAGSPFLFSDWTSARIFSNEGDELESEFTKLHFEKDAFLIKIDNKIIELNKYLYNRIVIQGKDKNDNSVEYTYVNNLQDKDYSYYRAIYQGEEVAFLERTTSKIVEKTAAKYGAKETSKRYAKTVKTYMVIEGKLVGVKKGHKNILKALGSPRQLEKYISKNKLKCKDDHQIAMALEEYDRLLADKSK